MRVHHPAYRCHNCERWCKLSEAFFYNRCSCQIPNLSKYTKSSDSIVFWLPAFFLSLIHSQYRHITWAVFCMNWLSYHSPSIISLVCWLTLEVTCSYFLWFTTPLVASLPKPLFHIHTVVFLKSKHSTILE